MRWGIAWLLGAALVPGCRSPSAGPDTIDHGPVEAAPAPDVRSASYALYWSGQRVGEAREQLTATRFVRRERLAIRRGPAVVELGTDIDVELGPGMMPRRVLVTRTSGGERTTGRAVHVDGRWRVVDDIDDHAERPRWLEGDAVPVELVPWRLGRPDAEGPAEMRVLLSGHGFATADLYVRPLESDARRLVAVLSLPGGLLTSEIQLDATGAPELVASDGGLASRRVDDQELYATFDPPELVRATSIAVAGPSPRGEFVRLVIDGVSAVAPPSLPGQVVRVEDRDRRWIVTLAAGYGLGADDGALSGRAPHTATRGLDEVAQRVVASLDARSPLDELRALVRYTDQALSDDLGVGVVDARGALAMGRGDCKAHTAVFAELASARGFEVALVTGYRLVDGPPRLARHRWALVRLGDRWMAVDPTYGEAPAAPRLLGVAVHSEARELPLADELAFAGFTEATAHLKPH